MIREYRGQAYTMAGRIEHQRQDGTMTTLLQWESHCAECGALFTFKTPAASAKFEPNRRCQDHKRPGHRVKEAKQ